MVMIHTFRELAIVSSPVEGGALGSQNGRVSRIRITVAIIVIVCGLAVFGGGAPSFAQNSPLPARSLRMRPLKSRPTHMSTAIR